MKKKERMKERNKERTKQTNKQILSIPAKKFFPQRAPVSSLILCIFHPLTDPESSSALEPFPLHFTREHEFIFRVITVFLVQK